MELAGGASGLRTEISGELESALASVTEASGGAGRRYDKRVCRALVQTIAARAYGRPLMELAYLIAAADRLAGRHGYLGFFWAVPEASGASFRAAATDAAITRGMERGISAEAQELVISGVGPEFRISYSRMPFLAALLDFCVTALGFDVLDKEVEAFRAAGGGRDAAQSLANGLSRRLYDFLKQHLPSQQHERKFAAMCGFLATRSGIGARAEAIDDRTVLAFWEERCADPAGAGDFRGFRTVVLDFLRLREALLAAETRHAVERAASIGSARDIGEVDPDEVLGVLEVRDERRAALAELVEPPASRLKSINKKEAARLELLLEAGEAATVLPLTVLRAEVFGAHQARIIQALRKRRAPGADGAAETLIEAPPVEDYAETAADFEALSERLLTTRKALMYLLFLHRRPEALEIGIALFPELAGALRERVTESLPSGNVVELHAGATLTALLEQAVSLDPAEAPEAEIFRSGKLAFATINRRGFEEARALDPETGEAALASEAPLRRCGRDLDRFLGALSRSFALIAAERVFAEDCRRFRGALRALYGEFA